MSRLSKALEALEYVAPYWPISQDEMGGCVFCGGCRPDKKYAYADRYLEDHTKDCAWVMARKVLGDYIPATRSDDGK